MGAEDFCDANPKILIVPINYPGNSARYLIKKRNKRESLNACISMACLCPKVLFTVTNATIDFELYDHIPIQNVTIVQTPNGFVNTNCFSIWLSKCFLPHLHLLRYQYHYFGPALLIIFHERS